MLVKEAMTGEVRWYSPDTPIQEVARVMRDERIGCVPIGENDRLVGMVTDRDITCRGVAAGERLDALTCRAVMSPGIFFCFEDQTLEQALGQEPRLAEENKGGYRYDAACFAALAGMGEGEDVSRLGDEQRARRRGQALAWLHADLRQQGRALEKAEPAARTAIVRTLQHWLHDPDLSGYTRYGGLSMKDGFPTPWPGPAGGVNADGRVVDVAGLRFAGLGGSIRYNDGPNRWTQRQQARRARRLVRRAKWRRWRDGRDVDVLLTHSPPLDLGDRPDPPHRGFACLHSTVDVLRPKWLLHGHIHPHGEPVPDRVVGETRIRNVVGHRIMEFS